MVDTVSLKNRRIRLQPPDAMAAEQWVNALQQTMTRHDAFQYAKLGAGGTSPRVEEQPVSEIGLWEGTGDEMGPVQSNCFTLTAIDDMRACLPRRFRC